MNDDSPIKTVEKSSPHRVGAGGLQTRGAGMNLGKILAEGKSIMKGHKEIFRRTCCHVYLPKFGVVKNPFKPETAQLIKHNTDGIRYEIPKGIYVDIDDVCKESFLRKEVSNENWYCPKHYFDTLNFERINDLSFLISGCNFDGILEKTFLKAVKDLSHRNREQVTTPVSNDLTDIVGRTRHDELFDRHVALERFIEDGLEFSRRMLLSQRNLISEFFDTTLLGLGGGAGGSDLEAYRDLFRNLRNSFAHEDRTKSIELVYLHTCGHEQYDDSFELWKSLRTRASAFTLWLWSVYSLQHKLEDLTYNRLNRLNQVFSTSYDMVSKIGLNAGTTNSHAVMHFVDLAESFCRHFDFAVRKRDDIGVPAFLMKSKGKKKIFVRDSLADRDKFRLILHEVGHDALKHRSSSEYGFDASELQPELKGQFASQEAEAELFASSCLFSMLTNWNEDRFLESRRMNRREFSSSESFQKNSIHVPREFDCLAGILSKLLSASEAAYSDKPNAHDEVTRNCRSKPCLLKPMINSSANGRDGGFGYELIRRIARLFLFLAKPKASQSQNQK
jgi:hypothetical protein